MLHAGKMLLSRTRCCVVGVLLTHGILLLAIALALVVALSVYGDRIVQDMPGDMRRIQLGKSTVRPVANTRRHGGSSSHTNTHHMNIMIIFILYGFCFVSEKWEKVIVW